MQFIVILNKKEVIMKVLSLFNGISCGRIALERANIQVDRYISYEIDQYANRIAQAHYPDDEYFGDVTIEDFTKYKGEIDIVIGGSPCTYWSIAKKDRETTSEGIGFELFSHFVRAIKETGARYFLYENNHSIHKDIKAEITKALGVELIMINSSLVSAQQRRRCYWTNIPGIRQPDDKGIILKDILESGIPYQDKSHVLTASYDGAVIWNSLERSQRSMIAELISPLFNMTEKRTQEAKDLRREFYKNYKKDFSPRRSKELTPRTDNKVNTLTTGMTKEHLLITPSRIGQIGKSGQANRVYSIRGKSVCLSSNGGGRGGKTGLYRIDLPDGDYIIRKLTPLECERLQTLPDNYTLILDSSGKQIVSNTQRYKGIGNGWTVDVIAHILKHIKE
jgi:DNA (cytosine-5)-methyltransferase 3A